ncbi:MAG: hypothetical protein HFF80_02145 [Oscillospiraceae bacterium]|jgi:hypothetical protein|nr:hypothetical protein [Oscillospiraceae bacterium]
MRRKKLRIFACVLLALTVLTAFAALAGGVGSQDDPLVTLSYLNDTFTGQVLEKVDKALDERNAALRQELELQISQREQALRGQLPGGAPGTGAASYAALELAAGQILRGEAGCEVLLRSGSAVCAASSAPGLVDTTSGGSINGGGALQPNHLYLMTEAREVTASTAVTLLVRGPYTVG